MRTFNRKLVSLLLAVSLLLLASFTVLADGPEEENPEQPALGVSGQEVAVEFTMGDIPWVVANGPQIRVASFAGGYNYGTQLGTYEKWAYNQIAASLTTSDDAPVTITFPQPLRVSGIPSSTDTSVVGAQIGSVNQAALDAFLRDYPEIFWLDVNSSVGGASFTPISDGLGAFYADVTTATFVPAVFGGTNISERGAILSKINSYVSAANGAGPTREAKLRKVYEDLAGDITYNNTAALVPGSVPRAHQISGAMIEGTAVCEGYAKAFKLICDELGIPCVLVSGLGVTGGSSEDHMWNYVQMEDGLWYGVDVTWYSTTNGSRDYFLVGGKTVIGSAAFEDSHQEDSRFSPTGRTFNYPSLENDDYVPGGVPGINPGVPGVDYDYTIGAAPGAGGWYRTDITVTADTIYPYNQVSTSHTGGFGASAVVGTESATGSVLYFSDGVNVVSGFVSYKMDKTPPDYSGCAYQDATKTLTVYATDPLSGISDIVVTDPDGNPLAATSLNQFTTTVYGLHTITITDQAGNVTTATFEVTLRTGSSSRGSGSSSGGTSVSDAQRGASTPASTAQRTSGNVAADGGVSQSAIVREIQTATGDSLTVQTRNASHISVSTLRAMASAAQGREITLCADTLAEDGQGIQGRIYVQPARVTGLTDNLNLEVYTSPAKTQALVSYFETWYSNSIAAVRLGHGGDLGARTHIAAKVDLTGMDTGNLAFYVYSRTDNTFEQITQPEYWIDANNFLHFHTTYGGDIIISSGPLQTR